MKKIYILSDATGQSGLDILKAALVQFENPEVKFTVFPKVESKTYINKILAQAKAENALITFTVVKKDNREIISEFCRKNNIIYVDILGPLINNISSYLKIEPLENPRLLRKVDERYFKRIAAIEFTIDHDDGQRAQRLEEADIVILGLSRTSKTPTSFFLAQQGFKVANVPIVPEIPLPEEVFKIDQNKISCLVMDPDVLQKVRLARLGHYKTESSYTDLRKIYMETEYVETLCRKHKQWRVINTTNRSVEETSREIIQAVFGSDVEYH
ncbi:MAG: pyruvate, water dikinase regulatory protein [Dissulfurispiraceae bacterium]|jgi:[pyruvate, water dikinase]-phosphate phosphotransferase / [pyruvate, water dikinase] kinase